MLQPGLRTWIEIDTKKLSQNVEMMRNAVPKNVKIMGIIKSNAYGHGLVETSKELQDLNIDWLGADSVTEALRLRKDGITIPILILGYTLPERVLEAALLGISFTVSSMHTLELWKDLMSPQKIKIHIKVDTGMHRQGFLLDERADVVSFLKKHQDIFEVEGLYTHFAVAKNPNIKEYTEEQIGEFRQWIDTLGKADIHPLTHAGATAGTLNYPNAHFDMVRPGAGMYGIWPSPETKEFLSAKMHPEPVLSWRSLISEIKHVPQGSGIGYDLTDTLTRNSKIAICPIGYWHGYPRSLSSKGEVLIRGMRAKVLGRIAMDMIILDVTDISDISVHDEVTLIGSDGEEIILADEVAFKAGISTYELLTRLNPLIRRIYI